MMVDILCSSPDHNDPERVEEPDWQAVLGQGDTDPGGMKCAACARLDPEPDEVVNERQVEQGLIDGIAQLQNIIDGIAAGLAPLGQIVAQVAAAVAALETMESSASPPVNVTNFTQAQNVSRALQTAVGSVASHLLAVGEGMTILAESQADLANAVSTIAFDVRWLARRTLRDYTESD